MKKLIALLAVLALPLLAGAQDETRAKDIDRLETAATILDEIMAAPDKGIPDEILHDAKCVAVVPSMIKGAFGFGGNYGKGVASCRTNKGWSAPAFFRIEGGSFGFQIGGQAVDVVMVIMNENGMKNLLSSKFKLDANASVAAGPVGRHADAATDWKLRAQVLTYSRARGVFAGVSLSGAVIKQHQDDTRAFYGHTVSFRNLLTGEIPAPADAKKFLDTLAKYGGNAVLEKTAEAPKPAESPKQPEKKD